MPDEDPLQIVWTQVRGEEQTAYFTGEAESGVSRNYRGEGFIVIWKVRFRYEPGIRLGSRR